MTASQPEPVGEALRAAMRRFASGVTVVTAAHGGRRAGMTVSAFLSVSLEPPTILVSLHAAAETLALARAAGAFAVSLLHADQEQVSARFAGFGFPKDADRFEGSRTGTRVTGAPVLEDALAWVDCRVRELHGVGTHVLLVGDVVAAGVAPDARAPLVYHDRGYRRLAP